MNALYFRNRAMRARMMAQSGDDIGISKMLLDVADELDAEADLMEAEADGRAELAPHSTVSGMSAAEWRTKP